MNSSLLTPLPNQFEHRDALIAQVRQLCSSTETTVSNRFIGGRTPAEAKLERINPIAYASTRNHADGAVTQLSPYIRHGIISDEQVYAHLSRHFDLNQCEKLLQQLSWRAFFHYTHRQAPQLIWTSREAYKTGFNEDGYATELPEDIRHGQTGIKLIDQLIAALLNDGYLHNHYRLYLASYVVHWRRVQWQAGARWMLTHLLDGDIASNNYSWQWVASTFSSKPYIFNLDNIKQFADANLDTEDASNGCFDASYDDLQRHLFPQLTENHS